jgi:hypothetical protein
MPTLPGRAAAKSADPGYQAPPLASSLLLAAIGLAYGIA